MGHTIKADATLMASDPREASAAAKTFEDQGFDGLISFEGPHDPFLPLALAAAGTEKIELMTGVAIAFARNPMTCAQLANDLQLGSGGRFILGLGTQIRPHIEKRFSQQWSRPNHRMREFVHAIRAIWRSWNEGERLDFRGEFYTHTLMTPFFNPGPNSFGPPPIYLAGFGPSMIKVVGEVADGWFIHPLHSRDYMLEVALPALDAGLASSGRTRANLAISSQIITMVGNNDEQLERARQGAKAQIAFYSSTPAYRGVLEHHGVDEIQPTLNAMSKQGRWSEMVELVSDDLLDLIGVSGRPSEISAQLRARNDFTDRVTMVLYNEADPEVVNDIVQSLKS